MSENLKGRKTYRLGKEEFTILEGREEDLVLKSTLHESGGGSPSSCKHRNCAFKFHIFSQSTLHIP